MGVALTRCLCSDILNDLWNITYERGKYGRPPKNEFSHILVRAARLYDAFKKELTVEINNHPATDKSNLSQLNLPTLDPFSDLFKTRGEKENEANVLVKQWVKEHNGKARTGVVIPQLGVVSDLIFSTGSETIAIEIMRYLAGIRGSWIVAKLRTLGALTTPMELERYGLVDRGGILLVHYANPEVVRIAEQIAETAIEIRNSSSYFVREFPVVGLVDLTQKKLRIYGFSQRNWLLKDYSLLGLSTLESRLASNRETRQVCKGPSSDFLSANVLICP